MMRLYGGNVFPQHWHKRSPAHEPAVTRDGGPIQLECCSWRSVAGTRAKLPFANPCSCPTAECLITSAAWRWRVLHLDNFNTLLAKGLSEILRSAVVRDQAPDSVEWPNL